MHAELTITHDAGDPLAALQSALPANDLSALTRSLVFSQNPQWQNIVEYATETPQWRLIAYRSGVNELQITIEPVQGNLKRACESVWRSFKEAASGLSPKLDSLELTDEATLQVMATGSVGLIPHAKRRELWLPILVAVATLGVAVASEFDGATVKGGLAAWIAGTLALLSLLADANRKKLVWHG